MVKHLISILLAGVSCLFSFCLSEEMTLNEKSCRILIDTHDRSMMYSRNFIGGRSNRWPNGVVPFTISSGFSESQLQIIRDSMEHIMDRTCVRFQERTDEVNYLDIYTGENGCFANLGYNDRRGRHVLHLQNNGCVFLGIVVHELLHILGFGHEQTRPDRDDYVQINWGNIQSGTHSNFWRALGETEAVTIPFCGNVEIEEYDNCYAGFRASTFGLGYDYGSVMHYGLNFFTNNGQDTITLRRETSETIPNRSGMSNLDAQKTQAAYECTEDGTAITTNSPSPAVTTTPQACRDTWIHCERFSFLCGRHSFINKRCQKTCFNCEV